MPQSGSGISLATGNTDFSGASQTGFVELRPAATNGTVITQIKGVAKGTTTAGWVNVFLRDNAGSPNYRYWGSIQVSAVGTVDDTHAPWSGYLNPPQPIELPPGWSCFVVAYKSEGFNVFDSHFDL